MGMPERVKCLIIGSGPAGYTAAIYTARANLSPVLYEGLAPGGQLTTTTDVENFPGYPEGVSGPVMMEDMKRQALRFNADVRGGLITKVNLSVRPFEAETDGGHKILADAMIIATGAAAKYLGLPSEDKYKGQGVSGCATCDGFFYKGQDVAVVGGGDTACEDALFLSSLCRKVYMIVRRNELRACKLMQHRVKQNPKIEMLFEHQIMEIIGNNGGVTGAILTK
jgi:thioredoxin reductase (NADPH)